jgi:ribosomal protein L7/L12
MKIRKVNYLMYLVFHLKFVEKVFGEEQATDFLESMIRPKWLSAKINEHYSEMLEAASQFAKNDIHRNCKQANFSRIFMNSKWSNEALYYLCNATMFYLMAIWEEPEVSGPEPFLMNPEKHKIQFIKRLKDTFQALGLKECKEIFDSFYGIYTSSMKEFNLDSFKAFDENHVSVPITDERVEQITKAYAMLIIERKFLGRELLSVSDMYTNKKHMFGYLSKYEVEYIDLFIREGGIMKDRVFYFLENQTDIDVKAERLRAVKTVKDMFDIGLKEAKDLVEEFCAQDDKSFKQLIEQFIDDQGGIDYINENKLQAIKDVKEEFDIGLKEAKDEVDKYYCNH